MIEFRYTGDELYARMDRAVEKVTQRLRKTVRIIEDARIPIYWIWFRWVWLTNLGWNNIQRNYNCDCKSCLMIRTA